MIRYDQTGQWPSSRRCGRACTSDIGGNFYGTENGSWIFRKPYDPSLVCVSSANRYGPYGTYATYDAICDDSVNSAPVTDWARTRTCPKGWGRSKFLYPNDSYSVQYSQGWVSDGRTPVYGYVTRYRTAYYNYITARVSKA